MGKSILMYGTGAASAVTCIITIAITAASLRDLPSHTLSKEIASLIMEICSFASIIVLTIRVGEECKTSAREWKLGFVRVRTCLCAFLFLSMVVVTCEMAWSAGSISIDSAPATYYESALLMVPRTVFWMISVYFQGCLCALSLILSNIRSNRQLSSRASTPAEPTPKAFRLGSPCGDKMIWEPTTVDEIPMRLVTPPPSLFGSAAGEVSSSASVRSQANNKKRNHVEQWHDPSASPRGPRSVASVDSMLRGSVPKSPPAPPSTPSTLGRNDGPSLPVGSDPPILPRLDHIHPLFRPNSPTPPPTPSTVTTITVPRLPEPRTSSLSRVHVQFNEQKETEETAPGISRWSTTTASEGERDTVSPTAFSRRISEAGKAAAQLSPTRRLSLSLPKFITQADLRNSTLRLQKRTDMGVGVC